MRAIDCLCGLRPEGATDEELIRFARQHVDSHQSDMERTNEEPRKLLAAGATPLWEWIGDDDATVFSY